jgi:ABC-type lipoprotein release transport system permease subunit
VLTIGKHLASGTLPTRDDDIVLGDGLAKKLGAHLGDAVTVHLPEADGHAERRQTFHLAGTLHMEFDDYDNGLGFITLTAGQALIGQGDDVMGIEMIVKDVEHADVVAKAYQDDLGGPPYRAMDWYELNKPMYSALLGDRRP